MTKVKTKTAPKKEPLTPVPTHWLKHVPDGDPPPNVLLLIQAYDEEEERPIVELGYWSNKVNQILSLEGNAIEEHFKIYSYHIVHDSEGKPFEI